MKTLLALALALGFQIPDLHAKPTIAFLGLTRDSDPRVSGDIARRIQWELSADTGLAAFSAEEVAALFAKGVLAGPEAAPADMPTLARAMGARYYVFGKLEAPAVTSKRILWKPWSLKARWTQGLRLRVLEGTDGRVVLDSLVTCEVPEKATFSAPNADLGKLSPLERESRLRILSTAVSLESAKALAKVLKEKAGGEAVPEKPANEKPGP